MFSACLRQAELRVATVATDVSRRCCEGSSRSRKLQCTSSLRFRPKRPLKPLLRLACVPEDGKKGRKEAAEHEVRRGSTRTKSQPRSFPAQEARQKRLETVRRCQKTFIAALPQTAKLLNKLTVGICQDSQGCDETQSQVFCKWGNGCLPALSIERTAPKRDHAGPKVQILHPKTRQLS